MEVTMAYLQYIVKRTSGNVVGSISKRVVKLMLAMLKFIIGGC